MKRPEDMEVISAPGADPRQWLVAYLRTRARLASLASDFQCDPDCSRPGCKNLDLLVQVSILDLLGLAGRLKEPVAAVYRRYCSLGLFPDGRTDLIRMVGMKLQRPCPFLENDLCGIYPVRPLPCILFPEYLGAEGKLAATAKEEHFRDYLCLHRPLLLSPERAGIMARLKQMWARETLFTSIYLFGHGPCYLDFGNLARELQQRAKAGMAPEAAENPAPGTIPQSLLEGFFGEHLARLQPFAGVAAKIETLDNREAREQLLRLFQDNLWFKKHKQSRDERALVFQFVKGKLKATRRSLLPREYTFY